MILRIGTRKLDAGGQHDIAERAFGDKASRHVRGRWLRGARQAFSVANDLVSGGERVRAIQVLLGVVHLVDALWLTGTYELPERAHTRYCRRRRVLWDWRWDGSTAISKLALAPEGVEQWSADVAIPAGATLYARVQGSPTWRALDAVGQSSEGHSMSMHGSVDGETWRLTPLPPHPAPHPYRLVGTEEYLLLPWPQGVAGASNAPGPTSRHNDAADALAYVTRMQQMATWLDGAPSTTPQWNAIAELTPTDVAGNAQAGLAHWSRDLDLDVDD